MKISAIEEKHSVDMNISTIYQNYMSTKFTRYLCYIYNNIQWVEYKLSLYQDKSQLIGSLYIEEPSSGSAP